MISQELMAQATGPLAPPWERREPGRLEWELAWLRYFGADPELDSNALSARAIWLNFDWSFGDRTVALTARFPDAYPRLRPNVCIRGGGGGHQRHVSPINGNVCLLGRDSRQWTPDLGLARLLASQLADALTDAGDQDPQGEPDEVWWNALGLAHSYILIDSEWDLGDAKFGFLSVRIHGWRHEKPRIHGWVREIRDDHRNEILKWNGGEPIALRSQVRDINVPWVRLDKPLTPSPLAPDLSDLIHGHEFFKRRTGTILAPGLYGQMYAVVYPMEAGVTERADGWLFPLVLGPTNAFVGRNPKRNKRKLDVVPTFRAGRTDIGIRVPAVALLRDADIAVVGAGAIGAPLILQLARNGARTLRILDHDRVEPGNSIRWPLGASAWAEWKVDALKTFVASEYPWCDVVPINHMIGDIGLGDERDEIAFRRLQGVKAIVDASASFGVTVAVNDWAREQGLPMISLAATPSVEGGIVAYYAPDGACPTCLEFFQSNGEIEPPAGQGAVDGMTQPLGCGERTFVGSSIDLEELSLQAARLLLTALSAAPSKSLVQTLSFVENMGARIPIWRVDEMEVHSSCPCH